jgi:hypothetical protein
MEQYQRQIKWCLNFSEAFKVYLQSNLLEQMLTLMRLTPVYSGRGTQDLPIATKILATAR